MEKLRTSLTILRHSLLVLGRNPRLLAFPLVGLSAAVLVYAFFFVPLLLHKSLSQTWRALGNPLSGWESLGPWHIAFDARGNPVPDAPFPGLAAYYLVALFVMSFVNVALYSQIITALNGGRVSVSRGLSLAIEKLPAIAVWSLLAGTVGVVLRAIQGTVGSLGRWVVGLAGLSWSAASVFVIPVMINEPRTRNPLDYLKISTGLIRRVWGEGIIGLGGMGLMAALVLVVLLAVELGLLAVLGNPLQVVVVTVLASLAIFSLLSLAWQVFECGLYVYATEGVAPGSFDERTFERVWTVKPGSPRHQEPDSPTVRTRRWPRTAFLAALVCASALWLVVRYLPAPQPPVLSLAGNIDIDIRQLDYRLDLQDIQAAGLFAFHQCPDCDFSASGTRVLLSSRLRGGTLVTMGRQGSHLHVVFYAPDAESGQKLVARTIAGLRARFPGHEDAIREVEPVALLHARSIAAPQDTPPR